MNTHAVPTTYSCHAAGRAFARNSRSGPRFRDAVRHMAFCLYCVPLGPCEVAAGPPLVDLVADAAPEAVPPTGDVSRTPGLLSHVPNCAPCRERIAASSPGRAFLDLSSAGVLLLLEEGLVRALYDRDARQRHLAATRLSTLGDIGPRGFAELVRRVATDQSPTVRLAARTA